MDCIPFALTGYLDHDAVSSTGSGTAAWRLTSSPDDCTEEQEAIIPCTTSDPNLVGKALKCETGDLLRVTGHLTLPDTADGYIRLDVDTLEVLLPVSLDLEQPLAEEDEAASEPPPAADHIDAITALAEALNEFARNAPGRTIGIHISPNGPLSWASEHGHILDISPALAHQLADHVNALSSHLHSQRSDGTVVDRQTIAELADHFDGLDLTELTRAVLDETRPEDRLAVTRALDDLFGDIPITGIDDNDQ